MIWKWFDCKLKYKNLQQIRLIMWTINVLAKKIKKSVLRLVTNLSYIYLSYIKYYIKNLQINLADGKRKGNNFIEFINYLVDNLFKVQVTIWRCCYAKIDTIKSIYRNIRNKHARCRVWLCTMKYWFQSCLFL